MAEHTPRRAPPGFTPEQWHAFLRDGYLVVEGALDPSLIARFLDAHDACARSSSRFAEDRYLDLEHVVARHDALAELIDHPNHVGFVYDVFGELLKLHMSQLFYRPPGSKYTEWHFDGPRVVPYTVFSPLLPLQVKVGWWLTDVTEPDSGNLVVVPGSHRRAYLDQYNTCEPSPEERQLCFPAGTITLMHGSIWHRTSPNLSPRTRRNLYIAYCPSWIVAGDRLRCDPAWLEKLPRERRILMRDYDRPVEHAKPPADDFPLFLDRSSGAEGDPGIYAEEVPLRLRKRMLAHERGTLPPPADT